MQEQCAGSWAAEERRTPPLALPSAPPPDHLVDHNGTHPLNSDPAGRTSLRVGEQDDTPRLPAPVHAPSPAAGSARSRDDADTGSLAYTARSNVERDVGVDQPADRDARNSGRAFLEDRELGYLRPSNSSPTRPGEDTSTAAATRLHSLDTSENASSPRVAPLSRIATVVCSRAIKVFSLAWEAVVPLFLDEERTRDYLIITLSRRLRSARGATRTLFVGVVSYAVACLFVSPTHNLLTCALTSVAAVVLLFVAYSSMRSATVSYADPRKASWRYDGIVAVLRLGLFGAVLAWEVGYSRRGVQGVGHCWWFIIHALVFAGCHKLCPLEFRARYESGLCGLCQSVRPCIGSSCWVVSSPPFEASTGVCTIRPLFVA